MSASGGGPAAAARAASSAAFPCSLPAPPFPTSIPRPIVQGQFGHSTQIITNSFATGTNYLVSGYKATGYGITKGFLTGTSVRLDMSSQNLSQNSPRNDFNPATSGNLGLTINQHLLQGFGLALNSRVIKIAKNNRHAADLSFKAQVIATVANVVDLYWDLVTYNENLKVRQQALELNQKLYTDNKRRAELGAIAPIDIVQAEAEVAASQQEVTNAETQVLQQEMILKNVLTRNGVDNLAIMNARIVPTDKHPRARGRAGRTGAGPGGRGHGEPPGNRAEPDLARKQPPQHEGHEERPDAHARRFRQHAEQRARRADEHGDARNGLRAAGHHRPAHRQPQPLLPGRLRHLHVAVIRAATSRTTPSASPSASRFPTAPRRPTTSRTSSTTGSSRSTTAR